jgi:hypothetical protein
VATGDKVVALESFLATLLKHWPRALGVEMEAGGVAAACYHAPKIPPFMMVRAVSDLADERKGTPQVERWRGYARDVAARYAVALIRSGPVPLPRRRSDEAVPRPVRPVPLPTPPAENRLVVGPPYVEVMYLFSDDLKRQWPIVRIHVRNLSQARTYDDVGVELRLPAGVAFIGSKGSGVDSKPITGQVAIPLSRPLHAGGDVDLGYVTRQFEPEGRLGALFGASRTPYAVEWTASARDVPPASGAVDVRSLDEDTSR